MIHIDFTPADIDALHHQRFHHPHPRVQEKMEAVYLKSQGLPHKEICRLSRISENTLRSYLRQFQEGGIERLKRLDFARPVSELADHREELEDYFRKNPPRSAAQAAADIERITGIRRGLTQVRKFLTGMGMKCRKLGMIPAKADADEQRAFLDGELWPRLRQAQRLRRVVCFGDAAHFVHGPYLGYLWCFVRLLMRGPSGRKRFNVLGAIDAVTHELTTICNDTVINAEAVCELLRAGGAVRGAAVDVGPGQRPLPAMCPGPTVGQGATDRVTLPPGVLAEPEPDRATMEVRQEGGPVLPVL